MSELKTNRQKALDEKTLEEILKPQRHAAVLKLLGVASAHRLNHRVLQEALCQIGIPSSAEQVQAALGWCAEQHLIGQEEIEGYIIAPLTPRGADMAGDKAHVPGVARSLE